MSIIEKVKHTISPPLSEEKLREKEIVKRFGLKKDPVIPHRYWIDDQKAINFNPGSTVSCEKAVRKLEELFDNPEISTMPRESRTRGPFGPNAAKKSEGLLGKLEPAIRNVSNETDRTFREEFSTFNPKAIEKELLSTGDVKYDPLSTDDFFGDLGKKKKKERSR